MQVDPFHSPRIGGRNTLRRVAVGSGKEIPYRLGGSAVSAVGRPRRRIIRRTLDPVIEKVCTLWLHMHGYACPVSVEWETINLQDAVEEAKAALYVAQAEKIYGEEGKEYEDR